MNLHKKLDNLKAEVDALQVATVAKNRPWYSNASTILSLTALVFSFGTTWASNRRATLQDLQSKKEELRGLLQRLVSLPKENMEILKKYEGDGYTYTFIGSSINQENSLLVHQASALADSLPESALTADEYNCLAFALKNASDYNESLRFFGKAISEAKSYNTHSTSLAGIADLHYLMGNVEAGRKALKQQLAIFDTYPGYEEFTTVTQRARTELSWASSELYYGDRTIASEHFAEAVKFTKVIPACPSKTGLIGQLAKTAEGFAEFGISVSLSDLAVHPGITTGTKTNFASLSTLTGQ